MKKSAIFLFALVVSLGMIYSAGITVNLPSGGPNYCKGSTHNITWTKTGSCTGSLIKINIFKDSVDPANFVEQLTAGISATSKPWTIGMGYVTGTYIIRVKTDDNSCFGDSAVFQVKSCITIQPLSNLKATAMFIKKPDLKISILPYQISPCIYQNTAVKFKVENIGEAKSVICALRVYMGKNKSDQWTVPALNPGRSFSMIKKLNPSGVGYIQWSATVDEDKFTSDSNRSNNFASYKMIIKGPDLKVINVSTPDYKKTIQQNCKIYVTVRNIGHCNSGKFEVDCDWKSCPLIAMGRKYKVHEGLKPGETATFEFSHRYACFGMKYPDIIVDKANSVKEEDESNNTGGMAFHISGDNIVGKDVPKSINY